MSVPPSVSLVIAVENDTRMTRRSVRRAASSGRAEGAEVIVAGPARRIGGVRCIDPGGRGVLRSWNVGAAAAGGEALMFLGEGRVLVSGSITALGDTLGRGAKESCAFAYGCVLGADGSRHLAPEWDPIVLGAIHPLGSAPLLVSRRHFEACGPFDEDRLWRGGSLSAWFGMWDLLIGFAGRGWRGERTGRASFEVRSGEDFASVGATPTDSTQGEEHEFARLSGELMRKHSALFDDVGLESLIRGNVMMRRSDANWIDETGYPIPHQVLYRVREEYESMTVVRLQRAMERAWRAIGLGRR